MAGFGAKRPGFDLATRYAERACLYRASPVLIVWIMWPP
jgi:hypothetical protein